MNKELSESVNVMVIADANDLMRKRQIDRQTGRQPEKETETKRETERDRDREKEIDRKRGSNVFVREVERKREVQVD